MPLLPILRFPDPRLKLVATPVEKVDDNIQRLASDMLETMYEAQGVGLASIQVNVQKRVIVTDVSRDQTQPLVLINPVIVSHEGETSWQEGCLSFPGIFAKVKRFKTITVQFLDRDGIQHTLPADDLLSICIQHEIDHLDGITFYDHLSPLKQTMLRTKLERIQRKSL